MSTFQLALVQFALGLAVSLWGYRDYRKLRMEPASEDVFARLEQIMFPLLPPETLTAVNRASTVLITLTGLAICAASF